MMRILVTPRLLTSEAHLAIRALESQGYEIAMPPPGKLPDEDDLLRLVPGCTGWLAGVEPVSPAVIEAAAELRVISRNGSGIDNLPMDAIRRRGIIVRTADGANAAGVAELTIALMLASLRHIPAADAGIKIGAWPRRRGREMRGRTIGVVGCGAIGREVIRLCSALGASILASDPLRPGGVTAERFRWAELPELIADADIVSLHCPALPGGIALIGAAELSSMPPDSIIVNTARASLVDEAAIIEALNAGRLSVYAADVFAEEPPRSLVLAGHCGVIATSHIGALTEESVDRATEIAVANLLEILQAPVAGSRLH